MNVFLIPLPSYAYDLLGLTIVLLFGVRGYFRGFVRELTSILSLLGALVLAKPLGSLALQWSSLAGLPSFLLTPLLITVGAVPGYLLLRTTLGILAHLSGLHRTQEGSTEILLRVGGAAVRSALGAFVVVTLGWSVAMTGSFSPLLLPHALPVERMPRWLRPFLLPMQIIAAHSEAFRGSLLGRVASETNPLPASVLEGAELLTSIVGQPERIARLASYEPITRVMQLPTIQQLLLNTEIRALAEKGDTLGLLSHPAVKAALEDPALREALKQIDHRELKKFLEEQR